MSGIPEIIMNWEAAVIMVAVATALVGVVVCVLAE